VRQRELGDLGFFVFVFVFVSEDDVGSSRLASVTL